MSFYRYVRVKWIVIDELIYIFLLLCGCSAHVVRRLNTTQVYGKDKGNLSSRSMQKLSDWHESLCG